jgi:calmodulin
VFDKENRGYITNDEMRQILTELGEYMEPTEIEELIYEGDPNQTGAIDYQAFVAKLFTWAK